MCIQNARKTPKEEDLFFLFFHWDEAGAESRRLNTAKCIMCCYAQLQATRKRTNKSTKRRRRRSKTANKKKKKKEEKKITTQRIYQHSQLWIELLMKQRALSHSLNIKLAKQQQLMQHQISMKLITEWLWLKRIELCAPKLCPNALRLTLSPFNPPIQIQLFGAWDCCYCYLICFLQLLLLLLLLWIVAHSFSCVFVCLRV